MSSFSLGTFLNTSLDAVTCCFQNISAFLLESLSAFNDTETYLSFFDDLPESLYFDEFQWILLQGFLIILLINLLLICAAWRLYGRNICERFMKPATSKAIEELKASVSRLKLPKEHTPRI